MPTSLIDLAMALGLSVALIGVLLIVGRIKTRRGNRFWRFLRNLMALTVQAVLIVGSLLLILRYMHVDVAWLVLLCMLMAGIGASVARHNHARQPRSAIADNPSTDPPDPTTVGEPATRSPADTPALGTAATIQIEPVAGEIISPVLSDTVPAVEHPVPASDAAPASSDSVEHAGSETAPEPSILATAAQDGDPDIEPPDPNEASADTVPSQTSDQRPWQYQAPAPLRPRSSPGKRTIRAMRTDR